METPKKKLKRVISGHVTACGGDPELASFEDVTAAINELVEDERSEAESDGYDDGYMAGSADATRCRSDADESRAAAILANDTLTRVLDRLGWDRFDRLRFEQTGEFPKGDK